MIAHIRCPSHVKYEEDLADRLGLDDIVYNVDIKFSAHEPKQNIGKSINFKLFGMKCC